MNNILTFPPPTRMPHTHTHTHTLLVVCNEDWFVHRPVLDIIVALCTNIQSRRLPTVAILALCALTAASCSVKLSEIGPSTFWDDLACTSFVPQQVLEVMSSQIWFKFFFKLFWGLVNVAALAFVGYLMARIYQYDVKAKAATKQAKAAEKTRKAAQKKHAPQAPKTAHPPTAASPSAQLGLSADPSTTSRAIVLHSSAVTNDDKDLTPPSTLRRPRAELLPSDLAAAQGKAAVLVTWAVATDSHRVRTTSYLCTKVFHGQHQPVFSGNVSGCEVVAANRRFEYWRR